MKSLDAYCFTMATYFFIIIIFSKIFCESLFMYPSNNEYN